MWRNWPQGGKRIKIESLRRDKDCISGVSLFPYQEQGNAALPFAACGILRFGLTKKKETGIVTVA